MNDQTPISDAEARAARGDQRDSMLLHAVIRRADRGAAVPVRIRNLSAGGMMAECDVALDRGETIEVELRNIGTVAASVAWAVDGRIGVAFDRPIDRLRARRPVQTPARTAKGDVPRSRRPGLRIG